MKLINDDCILAMSEMPDNSVDSIVTDPPYELGFMGKSWDSSGIAFNVEVWQEALRVLKPGGHLIAFSGSRTYHRMAVAIEDAGFEIRDQIMWVYGSGFPKSHNISKGIYKAAGAEREVVGETKKGAQSVSTGRYGAWGDGITPTAPFTDEAQQWQGWGTALKPAHEPMVLARKPLIGTVAKNVLTYGTGGLNIDGSRVPSDDGFEKAWDKPVSTNISAPNGKYISEGAKHTVDLTSNRPVGGRFPANFIHDGSDEVVALFPEASSGSAARFFKQIEKDDIWHDLNRAKDSASKLIYCAKASKRDRNEGLEVHERVNHHPTVKPTDLMRYLCRLITPPNGIVLDPFMGSGSTGKAAKLEGFDFIGIDQSAEYLEIARARIAFVEKHPEQVIFPKDFERDELVFDFTDKEEGESA